MLTRICNVCKQEKPLNRQYFYDCLQGGKDGFEYRCLVCHKRASNLVRNRRRLAKDRDRFMTRLADARAYVALLEEVLHEDPLNGIQEQ
jgi:hypothetical protein